MFNVNQGCCVGVDTGALGRDVCLVSVRVLVVRAVSGTVVAVANVSAAVLFWRCWILRWQDL